HLSSRAHMLSRCSSSTQDRYRTHFSLFFLMIRRPPRSTLFPLHDALPISWIEFEWAAQVAQLRRTVTKRARRPSRPRSEEHTSELQSHLNLVCRLLLEKKKNFTVDRPKVVAEQVSTDGT